MRPRSRSFQGQVVSVWLSIGKWEVGLQLKGILVLLVANRMFGIQFQCILFFRIWVQNWLLGSWKGTAMILVAELNGFDRNIWKSEEAEGKIHNSDNQKSHWSVSRLVWRRHWSGFTKYCSLDDLSFSYMYPFTNHCSDECRMFLSGTQCNQCGQLTKSAKFIRFYWIRADAELFFKNFFC